MFVFFLFSFSWNLPGLGMDFGGENSISGYSQGLLGKGSFQRMIGRSFSGSALLNLFVMVIRILWDRD